MIDEFGEEDVAKVAFVGEFGEERGCDAAVSVEIGEDGIHKVECQTEGVDYHKDPFA